MVTYWSDLATVLSVMLSFVCHFITNGLRPKQRLQIVQIWFVSHDSVFHRLITKLCSVTRLILVSMVTSISKIVTLEVKRIHERFMSHRYIHRSSLFGVLYGPVESLALTFLKMRTVLWGYDYRLFRAPMEWSVDWSHDFWTLGKRMPFTARQTIDLLKEIFCERVFSGNGPVNWSPTARNLTSLYYLLWICTKLLVYANNQENLDVFIDNIGQTIVEIRPKLLENVVENWTSKMHHIRDNRGDHMPDIISRHKWHKNIFLIKPIFGLKLYNLIFYLNLQFYTSKKDTLYIIQGSCFINCLREKGY